MMLVSALFSLDVEGAGCLLIILLMPLLSRFACETYVVVTQKNRLHESP